MKLVGEVTWVLKNKDTGIEEARGEKRNVITDLGIQNQIMNGQLSGLHTIVGNYPLAQDRYNPYLPGSLYALESSVIGQNWFEASGGNPMYYEYHTRFSAPTSTRSIYYIALTNMPSSAYISAVNSITTGIGAGYPSFGSYGGATAYVSFSTPCTQTSSQVLDIYYRILFPVSQNTNFTPEQYRLFCRDISGQTQVGGNAALQLPFISRFQLPSTLSLITQHVGGIAPSGGTTVAGGFTSTGASAPSVTKNFSSYKTSNIGVYGQYDHVGELLGALCTTTNAYSMGLHFPGMGNITKASPIQNVINHGTANVSPMLDVSNLATGTGLVIPSGTWTNPRMPEYHYINITGTGSATTATYTYKKRYTTGFVFLGTGPSGTVTYQDTCAPISGLFGDNVPVEGSNNGSPVVDSFYPVEKTIAPPWSSWTGAMTTTGVTFTGSVPYDQQTLLVPFPDRVIKYAVPTGAFTLYNNENYSSFTASSISQVCVDNAGNIYVACQATGLWRITPSNTITLVTGAPANQCYGVAYSPTAGGIVALFNGGLCKVTGTAVASTYSITFTGLTDSNWNTCSYLVVDPNTAWVLIVRRWDAAAVQTTSAVWYNTSTGAGSETGLTLPSESVYSNARINKSLIQCSPNTSFWVAQYGNTSQLQVYYKLTPGSGTTTLLYTSSLSVTNNNGTSPVFEYDLATSKDVLIGCANMTATYVISTYTTYPTIVTITDTGTVSSTQNGSMMSSAGGTNGSGGPGTMQQVSLSSNINSGQHDMFALVRLDKGIYVMLNTYSFGSNSFLYAFATPYLFDGTLSGGAIGSKFGFRHFSWNGSAWVEVDAAVTPTSKTATTSASALENGWSVAFTAGASEPSFVSGEYYTFGTFEGILKDNATSLNLSQYTWWKKPNFGITDLEATTVPSNTASTGNITTVATQSGGVTVSSNAFVIPYANGAWAEGQALFRGDLDLTFSSFPTPAGDFAFGIGQHDYIRYGFLYTGGSWYVVNNYNYIANYSGIIPLGGVITSIGTVSPVNSPYTPGTYTNVPLTSGSGNGATANITITGAIGWGIGGNYNVTFSVSIVNGGLGYLVGNSLSANNSDLGGGAGSGLSIPVTAIGNVTTPTSAEIIRTASSVVLKMNGGTAHTYSESTENEVMAYVARTLYFTMGATSPSTITMPVATVASATSSNVLRLGKSASSNGSFDPLFSIIDPDAALQFQMTINGTQAAAIHSDSSYSLPGVGEVTIQSTGGYLTFNSANVGQSVTISNGMYLSNYN